MPVAMPAKLLELSRADDPKQAIWDAIGPAIKTIKVFGRRLLVGTYIEPEKTKGGIIRPGKTLQESQWQGCVGVVLMVGATAFKYDGEAIGSPWEGPTAAVNDWVTFKFSHSREFYLNGVSVRFLDDRNIDAVIDDPTIIY